MPAWKPGQSGNPKGRPKNTRLLSERLRAAASKTIEVDGKPIAGSIVAARLAWEAITKGKVKFPDDDAETVLSFDQWLGLMKFVYGQTEGPPPSAVEVSGADGGPLKLQLERRFEEALERAYGETSSDGGA